MKLFFHLSTFNQIFVFTVVHQPTLCDYKFPKCVSTFTPLSRSTLFLCASSRCSSSLSQNLAQLQNQCFRIFTHLSQIPFLDPNLSLSTHKLDSTSARNPSKSEPWRPPQTTTLEPNCKPISKHQQALKSQSLGSTTSTSFQQKPSSARATPSSPTLALTTPTRPLSSAFPSLVTRTTFARNTQKW